jgi:TetR/AcrR family transcriptional regulator, ethionamide resistance regulator
MCRVSASVQRTRQREQRESTRREILEVANRFLRERPYRELSVEVVMAETNLTRTAFYRHFDDVTDLVLRLLTEVARDLQAVAERWVGSAGAGYPAAAKQGLAAVVDFFVSQGPLVRAITEAAASDAQIEQAYRETLEGLIEITAGAIDRAVDEGLLVVPDSRALARALNLMNVTYLLQEFGREPYGNPTVALATLETVWLRVLRPVGYPGDVA